MSTSPSSSYGFAAKPRAVGSKKFRRPGLSLISDRRVIRGTTVRTSPIQQQQHLRQQNKVSIVILSEGVNLIFLDILIEVWRVFLFFL